MLQAGLQGQEERSYLFKMTPELGLKARPDPQGEDREDPLQAEGRQESTEEQLESPGVERGVGKAGRTGSAGLGCQAAGLELLLRAQGSQGGVEG